MQAQEHALFAAQSETDQHIGEAIDTFGQLAIRVRVAVVDVRDLVRSTGPKIPLEQIVRRVVLGRKLQTWRTVPMVGRTERGHLTLP